ERAGGPARTCLKRSDRPGAIPRPARPSALARQVQRAKRVEKSQVASSTALLARLTTLDSAGGFGGEQPREHPKQEQAKGEDADAHQLGGRDPAVEIILRIIAAKRLNQGTQDGVTNEEGRKHLPLKFSVAKEPGQKNIQQEVERRIINL